MGYRDAGLSDRIAIVCQRRDAAGFSAVTPASTVITADGAAGPRPKRLAWEQFGLPRLARRVRCGCSPLTALHLPLRRIVPRGRDPARRDLLHCAGRASAGQGPLLPDLDPARGTSGGRHRGAVGRDPAGGLPGLGGDSDRSSWRTTVWIRRSSIHRRTLDIQRFAQSTRPGRPVVGGVPRHAGATQERPQPDSGIRSSGSRPPRSAGARARRRPRVGRRRWMRRGTVPAASRCSAPVTCR